MAESFHPLSLRFPLSGNSTLDHGIVDVNTFEFTIPTKQISGPDDIAKWEKSQAYSDMMSFILTLNDSVKNKKMRDEYHVSQVITNLTELLDTLCKWVDEIPPIEQPQRFGNKAFRDWYKRLEENADSLVGGCISEKFHRALPELLPYLLDSFGNSTRIDYGTGHEFAFASFLCCLYKIGALEQEDNVAVVFKVFNRYLQLMRKLLLTYRMEPAGSHGVWSLDDHQFIPFIWGSAQLINHQRIQPKSFTNPDICEGYHKDYMFLGCINFINQVKTGPFPEHSNSLWNISGVPKWEKVNTGLVKMYKAEVLSKFPVIQHCLFGSLLTLQPARTS